MNNSSFDRFSELDMKAFNFIASQPNLFNLLVHSVCPSIYGQELVKAGILLCLAGGVSMENRRGNIHVLMVGDPGLGKSQLLRAASALSPRGVFVCGNTASGSGLTVTMAKDKVGIGLKRDVDHWRFVFRGGSVGAKRWRVVLHRRIRQNGR